MNANAAVAAAMTKVYRGYRVDLKLALTGTYVEYTALKKPVDRQFADSLADGLKRQGAPGRIVSVPDGKVVDSW